LSLLSNEEIDAMSDQDQYQPRIKIQYGSLAEVKRVIPVLLDCLEQFGDDLSLITTDNGRYRAEHTAINIGGVPLDGFVKVYEKLSSVLGGITNIDASNRKKRGGILAPTNLDFWVGSYEAQDFLRRLAAFQEQFGGSFQEFVTHSRSSEIQVNDADLHKFVVLHETLSEMWEGSIASVNGGSEERSRLVIEVPSISLDLFCQRINAFLVLLGGGKVTHIRCAGEASRNGAAVGFGEVEVSKLARATREIDTVFKGAASFSLD
jgi:hypothetical protein